MSRQKEPEHCKSQVVEMFFQKPRKWSSVCENIGVMLKNYLKKLYLKVGKLRTNMKQ